MRTVGFLFKPTLLNIVLNLLIDMVTKLVSKPRILLPASHKKTYEYLTYEPIYGK